MKKILFLLLVLIFICGCDGVNFGGRDGIDVFDPYQGPDGLIIDYLPNSPPKRVKSGGNFRTGVTIENRGAFDVSNGKIAITYNSNDLLIKQNKKNIKLLGKSKLNRVGEAKTYFWETNVAQIQQEVTSQIGFVVTYKYQTNAFLDYCIDPDTYEQQIGDKSCQSTDTISLSNQGAPVSVSKISSTYFPTSDSSGDIELEITVKNHKNGKIFGGVSASNPGKENTATLHASISGKPIKCDEKLKFEENTAETKCYINYNLPNEESKPLHIVVDYVYQQTVPSVEFTIEKIPNT